MHMEDQVFFFTHFVSYFSRTHQDVRVVCRENGDVCVCSYTPVTIKMSWVIDVKVEYTPVPKHCTLKVYRGMKLRAVHIFWCTAVGEAYVSLDSDTGEYHFQPSHDSSEKNFWCCYCWTSGCPACSLWLHWLIWAGCDVWKDKKCTSG